MGSNIQKSILGAVVGLVCLEQLLPVYVTYGVYGDGRQNPHAAT